MLLDDRESHPMTCAAEFTFDGSFDRPALEAAVKQAYARHPLFRSIVRRIKGRWYWQPASEWPRVQWTGEQWPLEFVESKPIDLRHEVGMRVAVREHSGQSQLLFDFHHACADGVGGLSFVEDIFTFYSRLRSPGRTASPPPRIDFERLRNRALFEASAPLTRSMASALSEVMEVVRFLSVRPSVLVSPTVATLRVVPPPEPTRMSVRQFPPAVLSRLRAAAADSGCSLNDLLLRSLFVTVMRWNDVNGASGPDDAIRVLMPMNLRNRADLAMPAVNRTGNGFLTRTVRAISDDRRLLGSIAAESAILRKSGYGVRWLSMLRRVQTVPRLLPLLLSAKRCRATAVLSNMGDPTRRFRARLPRDGSYLVVGDVCLRAFCAITPNRPLTRAVVLANNYANCLTIAARLDPSCYQPFQTQWFLQEFAEALMETGCREPLVKSAVALR